MYLVFQTNLRLILFVSIAKKILNNFADHDSINFTLSRKQFQLPWNAAKRLMYQNIVLGFAKLLRKKRKAGQW